MVGDVEIRCPAPSHKNKAFPCGSFVGKFNELGLILRCNDRKCRCFTAVNKVKGKWVFALITNPETIKALRKEKSVKKDSKK